MALTVHDVSVLHDYALGVMNRADHHAKNVEEIALALIGAIVWRKDDAESIKVLSSKGKTGNVLWVTISGQKYAFSYSHQAGQIEMRKDQRKVQYSRRLTTVCP